MKKQIIVTTSWDDGHILDLHLANLLQKYKVRGTFYISPRNHEFRKSELLKDSDIKLLAKNFEIGAHTMTHPDLTKVSLDIAKKEIDGSKKYLEKILDKKLLSFCYPYGRYNSDVKKIVKDTEFKMARTVHRFAYELGNDFYSIPTSTHAYTHKKDLLNGKLLLSYKTINWDILAKKQFDQVLKKGGIFHLWGHSWEIEKFHDYETLEKVLTYISNKRNVSYLTNSELII